MEILLTIDKILALPVVRWLLLATTVAAVATATWCKLQIGTVRLQRDAAQGQAATYQAHLQVQNAAIIQSGQEYKRQQNRTASAAAKAEEMAREAEKWRKKWREQPLTGTCDQMVDQVIHAIR